MLSFHGLTIITEIKALFRSWTVVVSLGPQSVMLSQGETPDILNFTVLPSCLAEFNYVYETYFTSNISSVGVCWDSIYCKLTRNV